MTTHHKTVNIIFMSEQSPEFLVDKAILYGKLLNTTRDLIQILNDNNEDTGDLPAFYEKTQIRAQKCIEEIDKLL